MSEEVVVLGENVSKIYGSGETRVTALDAVSVKIQRGEMVAVMGPSGSGKTTFLNCLSGLDSISKGRVELEGRNIHDLDDRAKSEFRAKRTGFVFQSYNLLPVLSAVENVEMPLLVSGVPLKESRARALAMLADLGLSDRATHRPSELSGGQQQRVSIARALVARPAIVWADEPTGNLDEESAGQVTGLLRRLNRDQLQTIVIVTHSPEMASLCDRTLQMQDGRIVE
ncbi:MAG: ABC transporter ATP-binding protein [Thermoplasmata archaeon]|nr:ABC transporter ATP-binding protein [Thermoplasmata archaeon]